jgi:hypothetical protein
MSCGDERLFVDSETFCRAEVVLFEVEMMQGQTESSLADLGPAMDDVVDDRRRGSASGWADGARGCTCVTWAELRLGGLVMTLPYLKSG